jgi:hypothetical protein
MDPARLLQQHDALREQGDAMKRRSGEIQALMAKKHGEGLAEQDMRKLLDLLQESQAESARIGTDAEAKVAALSRQSDRVWRKFQWHVAAIVAIVAAQVILTVWWRGRA